MTNAPPSEASLEKNGRSNMVEHAGDDVKHLERAAVRKLDLTVLPILTMFYLLSFLVRSFYLSSQCRAVADLLP